MKKQLPKLFDLIGELRESFESCKFLNKQKIIDTSVNQFGKLLNSISVIEVTLILKEDYSENYSLEDNIENAIYDYINK